MRKLLIPTFVLLILSLCILPEEAATIELFDWGFNIDRTTYCYDGLDCTYDVIGYSGGLKGVHDLPSDIIDTSGIDLKDVDGKIHTGLGTVHVTVEGSGPHFVIGYFDNDIGSNGFDENGVAMGSPAMGQTWEIDEPGDGLSGRGTKKTTYYGDLLQFNFVKYHRWGLDEMVFYDSLDNQFLGHVGDAAMAMGWDFKLSLGETATITFVVSETQPTSGFYLRQFDSSGNIYFSSSLSISGVIETSCFDTIDNDGDGQADCADTDCEGVTDGACTTDQTGICSAGTLTCQEGAEECVADNQPQPEVCDNLDNDCNGSIDEGFEVKDCYGPDLVIKSISFSHRSVKRGSRLKIADITKNIGKKSARTYKTCYYLSQDTLKDKEDIRLKCRKVQKLKANKISRKKTYVKIPEKIPPGKYYLISCADDRGNNVSESDETNNCKVAGKRMKVKK